MTKQEEYTHMLNTKPYDLKTPIKGGKEIKWVKVWDHHMGASETVFKTLSPPPYEHKLIKVQEIDLMPVANKKIYKITIKRN
jgi:hypothetical protein